MILDPLSASNDTSMTFTESTKMSRKFIIIPVNHDAFILFIMVTYDEISPVTEE